MLRKHSVNRSLEDNLKLGAITAISSGMVNISSLVMFFSFTSNITGHYAILADAISGFRIHEALTMLSWLFLFFLGSFTSSAIIINSKFSRFLTHSIPLIIEIVILISIGVYGINFYKDTLTETKMIVGFLLLTMGVHNGLTASISNFAVKTTHLTGLTTDLAIYTSMFFSGEYKNQPIVKEKIKLFITIMICYILGGIIAGFVTHRFGFYIYLLIAIFMSGIILYDYYHIKKENIKLSFKKETNSSQN